MEPFTGWRKDPFDRRDYLHRRGIKALPDVFSLSQYLTDVRDQGNVASCVGFGIGMNLNHVKVKHNIFIEWCSPTYIYNGARFYEGTLALDCGCIPRNALKWTLNYGILHESFWPYDPNQVDQRAPTWKVDQANQYKGFEFFRCVDGIDGICDAISSNYFVSIGNPWFTKWMPSPPDGLLPVPAVDSSTSGMGHETCFYGYDRNQGVFFGVNSWGPSWGDHGLFRMPFEAIDVFKQLGGYDAYYLTYSKDIDPNPPVEPQPSPCSYAKGFTRLVNAGLALLGKGQIVYYSKEEN